MLEDADCRDDIEGPRLRYVECLDRAHDHSRAVSLLRAQNSITLQFEPPRVAACLGSDVEQSAIKAAEVEKPLRSAAQGLSCILKDLVQSRKALGRLARFVVAGGRSIRVVT